MHSRGAPCRNGTGRERDGGEDRDGGRKRRHVERRDTIQKTRQRPRAGKTRGELCMEFLKTWKDAGIPNADILRAMTINGYKVSETEKTRGPIKTGLFADLIAVPGNPLDDVDALKKSGVLSDVAGPATTSIPQQ